MVLAPVELADRRSRAQFAVAQVLAEDAFAEVAHGLDLGEAPRQPVPHDGIALAAVRSRQCHQAVELGPEEDRVGRRLLTTLVRQQRHRHCPTGTDLAHDVLHGRTRTGEVHLAELALVVEHLDGPHVDAGLVHRAQEERDAAVPAGVGIGAGEEEDPRRVDGERGPDLLAVDHPLVAVADGAGRERSEIGTRVRFRVALAPAIGTREDAREEPPSLLLGAPAQQRVADHLDPEVVLRRAGRHPRAGELLGQHHLLALGEPAPAVLAGPRDGQESMFVQRAAPRLRVVRSRRVLREEVAYALAEVRLAHAAPSSASALPRMIFCWSSSESDVNRLAKSAGSASPSACG